MAWTNGNYDQTIPAGSVDPKTLDTVITDFKKQVAERLTADVYGFAVTETDNTKKGIYAQQSKVSAYKYGDQSVANNVWVRVTFEEENLDALGEFAASTFTAQKTGYYLVSARVEYTSTTMLHSVAIYKNGVLWCGSCRSGVSVAVSEIIYLIAGQTIDIYSFSQTEIIKYLVSNSGGARATALNIHRLS